MVGCSPAGLSWNEAADEFEIRSEPDRLPGILFVPVPEPKTQKIFGVPTTGRVGAIADDPEGTSFASEERCVIAVKRSS